MVNPDTFKHLSIERFLEVSDNFELERRGVSLSLRVVDVEVFGKCRMKDVVTEGAETTKLN